MNDFNHYYDLRQAGYDPHEVGSGFLRSIRSAIKGFVRRIGNRANEANWATLKTELLELYSTLSMQHDTQNLGKEIDKYINKLERFQGNDRMQDGIRLQIVHMLNELRNHITDHTQQV